MPLPGPRNQFGADPGYANPLHETPTRLQLWLRPAAIVWPGESAGTGVISRRGNRQAPGQVRRLWRQAVNVIPASEPYSWTMNAPQPGRGLTRAYGPLGLTRATRYLTRSLYMGQGIDNSRYEELHTTVQSRHNYKPVTHGSGARGRPTTRNRMTSFGSRVPVLNPKVQAADTGSSS
jgi:hypothetical protein